MDSILTASLRLPAYLSVLSGISQYTGPAAFMRQIEARLPQQNNARGHIFERAFCEVLLREGIGPVYYQVRFTLRPIVDFDVLIFEPPGTPWSFSLKTSFRERWKQSYLEAVLLRNFYPDAQSYLVTLHKEEAAHRKASIANHDTPELRDCLLATAPEMDVFVRQLGRHRFDSLEPVQLFNGRQIG